MDYKKINEIRIQMGWPPINHLSGQFKNQDFNIGISKIQESCLNLQDSYKTMEETNCNMIDTIEQLRESFREIADELRQWREEIEAKASVEELSQETASSPQIDHPSHEMEGDPQELQIQFEMPKVIHRPLNALVFEEGLKRMAESVEVEVSIETEMVDIWNAYKVFDEMPNRDITVMGRGSWNFDPGGLDSRDFRTKDVADVIEMEKVISSCVESTPIVVHKVLNVKGIIEIPAAHKVLVEMPIRHDQLITRLVEDKMSEIVIDDWNQFLAVFNHGIGEARVLLSMFFRFWRTSVYPCSRMLVGTILVFDPGIYDGRNCCHFSGYHLFKEDWALVVFGSIGGLYGALKWSSSLVSVDVLDGVMEISCDWHVLVIVCVLRGLVFVRNANPVVIHFQFVIGLDFCIGMTSGKNSVFYPGILVILNCCHIIAHMCIFGVDVQEFKD